MSADRHRRMIYATLSVNWGDDRAREAIAYLDSLEADRELLRAYDGPGCRQHDLPESDAIAARADALAKEEP